MCVQYTKLKYPVKHFCEPLLRLHDSKMRIEYAMHPAQKIFTLRVLRVRLNEKPGADGMVKRHTTTPLQYSPFARTQSHGCFSDSVLSP